MGAGLVVFFDLGTAHGTRNRILYRCSLHIDDRLITMPGHSTSHAGLAAKEQIEGQKHENHRQGADGPKERCSQLMSPAAGVIIYPIGSNKAEYKTN